MFENFSVFLQLCSQCRKVFDNTGNHPCFHFYLFICILTGTEEKRQYLLKHFPRIKAENIGYSRDTSFEQMIMKRTNGRGKICILVF